MAMSQQAGAHFHHCNCEAAMTFQGQLVQNCSVTGADLKDCPCLCQVAPTKTLCVIILATSDDALASALEGRRCIPYVFPCHQQQDTKEKPGIPPLDEETSIVITRMLRTSLPAEGCAHMVDVIITCAQTGDEQFFCCV